MNVKIFKIINGDDILSQFEEKDDNILLTNPVKLMPMPTQAGGMGFGMLPWCMYSDVKEFEIKASHVIVATDAPKDFYNKYNEEYGPGIVTPHDSGIII